MAFKTISPANQWVEILYLVRNPDDIDQRLKGNPCLTGVGKALIGSLFAECAANNMGIFAKTDASARLFYESCGFQPISPERETELVLCP